MCHCLCAVFSISVDYAVCGLAPLGEYLVILLYEEQLTDDVCAVCIVFKFCELIMLKCFGTWFG